MAIARDATSSTFFESASSGSWSHTADASATVVFVSIGWLGYPSNTTVSALTYDGASILANLVGTKVVVDALLGNNLTVQTYYLLNPPSGAKTVAFTMSGLSYGGAGAVSYTGAVASPPHGTPATSLSTSGAAPSTTVTGTTAGNMVLEAVVLGAGGNAWVAGQTEAYRAHASSNWACFAEDTAAGGDKTMTWSGSDAESHAAMAFEILAGPPAGQPTSKRAGGVQHMHGPTGVSQPGSGRMVWRAIERIASLQREFRRAA